MRFYRYGPSAEERPVVEHEGAMYDVRPLFQDIGAAFFAGQGIKVTKDALDAGALKRADVGNDERIGSPIARPGAVICIGMNYAAHAAESGAEPPQNPVVFLKTPQTVVGPHDLGVIPKGSTKTDWEVELGVVIGAQLTPLESPSESAEHIGGYVLANDLSERDLQLSTSGGQWSKGKCAPGFLPLGPCLAPASEINPKNTSLRSWVNGEIRQSSSTADMIFDVYTLIYDLSQYMALEPGDLVITGTPEGVALSGKYPYIKDGDVVEIEAAGLGRQRQVFSQAR